MTQREWLRALRKQRKLTQSAVADVLGVTVRGYQQWEAGVSKPEHDHLFKLAELLGQEVLVRFAEEARTRNHGPRSAVA